jgi:hypothetical protein
VAKGQRVNVMRNSLLSKVIQKAVLRSSQENREEKSRIRDVNRLYSSIAAILLLPNHCLYPFSNTVCFAFVIITKYI